MIVLASDANEWRYRRQPMDLHTNELDFCVPDDSEPELALARTTHLAIGAHQDDIEIMAFEPIKTCFRHEHHWMTGVTVTDGRGSPRGGRYAEVTDKNMMEIRKYEQRTAAQVGCYGAMLQLGYPSTGLRHGKTSDLVEDIIAILLATRPRHLYTHNLADKHPTHVAVACSVVDAVRRVDEGLSLETFLGCEVWRGLDFLPDDARVHLDTTGYEPLGSAVIGVFDSQVEGGKRYDLAALGRRRANATYFKPSETDVSEQVTLAMDLMPLLDPDADVVEYVVQFVEALRDDIASSLRVHFPAGDGSD